jgi:hypothetical protein
MADITAVFNTALKVHNAPPVTSHRYSIDRLDEFLKEAYSIVCQGSERYTHTVPNLTTECPHSRPHCIPSRHQTFLPIHCSRTSTTTTTELWRPQTHPGCNTTTLVRHRKSFSRCRSQDGLATVACRRRTYKSDRADKTRHCIPHRASQTQPRWAWCDRKMGSWRCCHCEERRRRGRRGQAKDAQRTPREYCVVPASQAQGSWYSSEHNDGNQDTA